MNVKGIGEKSFLKLKPLISVGDSKQATHQQMSVAPVLATCRAPPFAHVSCQASGSLFAREASAFSKSCSLAAVTHVTLFPRLTSRQAQLVRRPMPLLLRNINHARRARAVHRLRLLVVARPDTHDDVNCALRQGGGSR